MFSSKRQLLALHILLGSLFTLLQAVTLLLSAWTLAYSSNNLLVIFYYFLISAALPFALAFVWRRVSQGHYKKAFLFYIIPAVVYLFAWSSILLRH